MARQGRAKEQLVAALEQTLLRGRNVTVETPAFLPDAKTGEPREYDVLLTFDFGDRLHRIGIEVRDRRRKVDTPAIEAFVTKTNDTEVDERVFVSSSGFYKPALLKAAAYSIRCLELAKVTAIPWFLAPGFVEIRTQHKAQHVTTFVVEQVDLIDEMRELGLRRDDCTHILLDASGCEIPLSNVLQAAWNALQAEGKEPPPPVEDQVAKVILNLPPDDHGPFMKLNGGKRKHRVSHFVVFFRYDVVHTLTPFEASVYGDVGSDQPQSEVVVSQPFQALGREIRMAIAGKSDDVKHPMFIVGSKGDTSSS